MRFKSGDIVKISQPGNKPWVYLILTIFNDVTMHCKFAILSSPYYKPGMNRFVDFSLRDYHNNRDWKVEIVSNLA